MMKPAAVGQSSTQGPVQLLMQRDMHGRLVGKREVPNLTPVNLQVFARWALEANRHVGDGLFVQ
jgi:hypothetical protein